MYIFLSAIFVLLIIGCVNIATHVAIGEGETDQGGYSKSEDTQFASDVSNEVASRISGIDRSNQEITESMNKTTEMLKQSRDRDFAIDKASPNVPKETRNKLYKRNK